MPLRVYSISDIKEILPYRYPILLIDRVWQEEENRIYGLKNITANEQFFNGHFPEHAIFPGVLQVEATQQVATIAVKDRLDPDNKYDIYLKSIANVKFRKPNEPGDRLLIDATVTEINSEEAKIKAENRNSSGICCQMDLVLGVRERTYKVKKPDLFNQYDKHDDIFMSVEDIKKYIPHRYPFLFVDYIKRQEGQMLTAIKNISYNEWLMHNYSPDYSVLPGSIQAEIIAQAGAAHTLANPENHNKLAYFMTIGSGKYYHPICPGDQLQIELDLPKPRSKFGRGKGQIYVDGLLMSEGEITFALVDK